MWFQITLEWMDKIFVVSDLKVWKYVWKLLIHGYILKEDLNLLWLH